MVKKFFNLNQFSFQYWKLHIDSEKILWVTLDCPDRTANILSTIVRKELNDFIDGFNIQSEINEHVEEVNGIVFKSDKKSGFAAGADITEFKALAGTEDFIQQSRKLVLDGWNLYEKLENLSNDIPTIALINGFCMGGGFEFALACKYIVTIDQPNTKMALPEVQLGIYPGWGGIKRLPYRTGVLAAFDLILTGKAIDSRKAKKIGLSDFSTSPRTAISTCKRLINTKPERKKLSILNNLLLGFLRPIVYQLLLSQVKKKVHPKHYPAPYGILELWKKHDGDPSVNLSIHDKIIGSDTTKNLIRIFFLRERLKSIGKVKKGSHENSLKHVHVVGAGTMGADIAIWCAIKGFIVTLQDTSEEQMGKAILNAHKSISRKIKNKALSQKIIDKLIPDVSGQGIKEADVIIEAIVENLDAKKSLFKKIESLAKPNAILATNTSSIRLEEISSELISPKRLIGIHFFNPVRQMPLVEVVKTAIVDEKVECATYDFVNKIGKLPLPVKSSPGFLVNAVLGPYLQNSMRSIDGGYSPEQVDQAMKSWGMPMGPLELLDVVGLDVMVAAGKAMLKDGDTPQCLEELYKNNHLGKKTNKGFYDWNKGKKIKQKSKPLNSIESFQLAENLIAPLIKQTEQLVKSGVVKDRELADAGVIFGTGFAPFRGGPLNYQSKKNKEKNLRV
jgi:3-hydroxyacyl-CoA dehydrogenase/enoyl-CoA hydratase/3-hydroxybutyryl-CoA epimerase